MKMWELYDTLLEGMDETETAEDFLIGPRWAVVRSSSGSIGIAPVIVEQSDRFEFSYLPEKGMPLIEIASFLKSWNLKEASLALAAVNAFYNSQRRELPDGFFADRNAGSSGETRRVLPGGRRVRKAFQTFCEEHSSEGLMILAEPVYDQEELAELPGRKQVLRIDPESQDYLYTAGYQLIPEADCLVLSGRTLVDKTAERMVELAVRNSVETFFFGSDVPLCPAFHQHGLHGIWGLVVDKAEDLMKIARVSMSRDSLLKTGHFEVLEWTEEEI